MTNFFEQFKNEARKVRLSEHEKRAMKARIFASPVPGRPSDLPARASHPSPYYFFSFQFVQKTLVPVMAVLVILVGSGTAYAAEGSLPGDVLYSVKVKVTEPIKTALATTPEARATVHLELAQRRVEEAEALAAAGRLSATTTAELEENFEEHANSADALALEVGHDDPGGAVEIKAKIHSSLSIHGAILAALGEQSHDKGSKENSGILAARVLSRARATSGRVAVSAVAPTSVALKVVSPVSEAEGGEAKENEYTRTRAMTIATAPAATSVEDTSGTTTQDKERSQRQQQEEDRSGTRGAAKMEDRAAGALTEARQQYVEVKSSLEADTVARLDQQFGVAAELMSKGSTQLNAGAWHEANANFTQALTIAVRLEAILKAQEKYRANIITPLLQLRFNGGQDDE